MTVPHGDLLMGFSSFFPCLSLAVTARPPTMVSAGKCCLMAATFDMRGPSLEGR